MPAVPPPSAVNVPFKSTTYTFAAGPQFYLRKWQKITLFARPGFGGIHESADLTFPVGLPQLIAALQLPVPNTHQTDTTWFVGVGGGCDFNVSRRVGSANLSGLDKYTSVLQFADGPAKLRQVHHWPDFSLGTFEVAQRRPGLKS